MSTRYKGNYAFHLQRTNWKLSDSTRLTQAVRKKMRNGIEEAGDVALNKLKDYIQTDVYNAYDPEVYQRTYDLLNSWFFYIGNNMNRGDHFSTKFTLYYDADNTTYEPELFQHGSYYGGDKRADIPNFVFNGVDPERSLFGEGAYSEARDALGDFQEWLDKDFNNEINKAMNQRGL